jgi:hypothetical protein
MATIAKTADGDDIIGKSRAVLVKITPAAADYATGGYSVAAGASGIGLKVIDYVEVVYAPVGWSAQWNSATNKVMVFGGSAAAAGVASEAAAATDFSASQGILLRIFGR